MSNAEESKDKSKQKAATTASFDSEVLGPGSMVGQFRIERELGRGAAGVVYLAHDTKLDRAVAIKSLPEEVASNPLVKSRFEREARLLAGLNHPNIATIHEEIEEAEGKSYLVLEYIAGDTLAERIQKGPLSIEEALSIGQEIAEGVAAAHEQGVIHRDLKPGNIKITPEGKVKVLDFGLAKAVSGEAEDQESTITKPGKVIGTPAYMSPEQARGTPADHRSDIWSFGCILFEMLTGKIPFRGETVSDTLANILQSQPELERLPESTPANIKVLLRRCLEKEPRQRLQSMADAVIEISETQKLPQIAPPVVSSGGAVSAPEKKGRLIGAVLSCVVIVIIFTVILSRYLNHREASDSYYISFPMETLGQSCFTISPDGRRVVYISLESRAGPLYLWERGRLGSRSISGTDGARDPFFSPDGKFIGFVAEGEFKVMPAEGGTPLSLVEAPEPRGASWGEKGILLAPTHTGDLIWVQIEGEKLVKKEFVASPNHLEKESSLRWPHFLPGGEAAIINVKTADILSHDDARLAWLDIRTGVITDLELRGTYPCYHKASGQLIFSRGGRLWACVLDLEDKRIRSQPESIVEGVLQTPVGSAYYDIADDGTMVFMRGSTDIFQSELIFKDRNGALISTISDRSLYNPSVSPKDDWLAVEIQAANDYIRIYSLNPPFLGRNLLRESEWENSIPIWTPKGDFITFSRDHEGWMNIYQVEFENPLELKTLTKPSSEQKYPTSWSPDEKHLLFTQADIESTGYDIYILTKEDKKAEPFANTNFDEWGGMFSPDGKYIAYTSNHEGGRFEVFLERFIYGDAPSGPPVQISREGGTSPVWSAEGDEIFFLNDNKMWSVSMNFESSIPVVEGEPNYLFDVGTGQEMIAPRLVRKFDVTRDGRFILMKNIQKDILPDRIFIENINKRLLELRK